MSKSNDIHIAAFPKSGITYLGFLLCAARGEIRPTFYNIDFLMIDSHKMAGREYACPWNDGFGNFIKTHSIYQPVPNVIYLLRNPFDTLKSYYFFQKQLGNTETAEEFVNGPNGISAWKRHVESWLINNRNVTQSLFLVEYEKLVNSPALTLHAISDQLGVSWDSDMGYALRQSELKQMRHLEDLFAKHNPVYRRFNLEFVRKGESREVAEFESLRDLIESGTREMYALAKDE